MGIAEMFADYACAEVDEFAYQFAAEGEARVRADKRREYSKATRMRVRSNPERREKNRKYHREYQRGWEKKRMADPVYAEKRRRYRREFMRRQYAAQKAARAA